MNLGRRNLQRDSGLRPPVSKFSGKGCGFQRGALSVGDPFLAHKLFNVVLGCVESERPCVCESDRETALQLSRPVCEAVLRYIC